MSDQLPRSPHLKIYRWHPAMIASITHRMSGLLLALFLPLYLFQLYDMSVSPERFQIGSELLQKTPINLLLWLMGSALLYHFCNGIRFMLQDICVLQTRASLCLSAKLVLCTAILGSGLLGAYLC